MPRKRFNLDGSELSDGVSVIASAQCSECVAADVFTNESD